MPSSSANSSGDAVVSGEMLRLAPRGPARVQRRQHGLLQVLQNVRHAGGQVVVEQHHAGIEIVQPRRLPLRMQRLQRQRAAVGQLQRAWAAVISGSRLPMRTLIPACLQDGDELRHVLQVELVARVVLRNQQHAARFRADFFDRALRRLHAQRQEIRVEVVEAAGKQVGVHRRQLEAAVAQIHRGIERRRVFQPLRAEPVLDGRAARRACAVPDRAAGRSVRW